MPYKDLDKRRAKMRARYAEKKKDPKWVEDRKAYFRKHNKEKPRSVKNSQLKYNYGIDLAGLEIMFEEQRGLCAVCHVPFTSTPFVDHDHTTQQVRGLLCRSCNSALGMVQDSVKILESAIAYLNKHKEK